MKKILLFAILSVFVLYTGQDVVAKATSVSSSAVYSKFSTATKTQIIKSLVSKLKASGVATAEIDEIFVESLSGSTSGLNAEGLSCPHGCCAGTGDGECTSCKNADGTCP